jgi:hypothetical protein
LRLEIESQPLGDPRAFAGARLETLERACAQQQGFAGDSPPGEAGVEAGLPDRQRRNGFEQAKESGHPGQTPRHRAQERASGARPG